MKALSTQKRSLVISLLSEGTPINATCRILHVGKHQVLRVIRETGAALADYMDKNFRDLTVERLAMDEAWQFVGKHGQRMRMREADRGDFWLWAGIDSDTKLIVGHHIGRRDTNGGMHFVKDIASHIVGHVQIVTDPHRSYLNHVKEFFGERGSFSYATEAKVFNDPFIPEEYPRHRRNGVRKIVAAEREAQIEYPDLRTATTCHIERFFLTIRQELKRFQRLGLGYSKDIEMHIAATAMQIGIYNLCRRNSGIGGQTPAQAAGIEDKRWTLEDVVALTEAHWQPRYEAETASKAKERRKAQDIAFMEALYDLENPADINSIS